MKCPVCGKDTAYFYREDGMIGEPVATAEIDVILKRNSIIVYND